MWPVIYYYRNQSKLFGCPQVIFCNDEREYRATRDRCRESGYSIVNNGNDNRMLSYLSVISEGEALKYGSNVYFCGSSKFLKNGTEEKRAERIREWTQRNGGTFVELSGCMERGGCKGKFVRIVFPTYTKRQMKLIMSTLFLHP